MDIGPFLQRIELKGLSPPAPLSLLGARFSLSGFDRTLFTEHGIYQPDNIVTAVDKRRAEYFAGRYLAAKAFAEFGLQGFDLHSDKTRGPIWPEGFIGSISHTDNFACCVLALADDYLALGIDAQAWIPAASATKLARRILSPAELAVLDIAQVPLTEGLSLAFSAKESIYKAFHPHVRRFFGYREAELRAIDLDTRQMSFALSAELQQHPNCPQTVSVDYCTLDDGILSAVMLKR